MEQEDTNIVMENQLACANIDTDRHQQRLHKQLLFTHAAQSNFGS